MINLKQNKIYRVNMHTTKYAGYKHTSYNFHLLKPIPKHWIHFSVHTKIGDKFKAFRFETSSTRYLTPKDSEYIELFGEFNIDYTDLEKHPPLKIEGE